MNILKKMLKNSIKSFCSLVSTPTYKYSTITSADKIFNINLNAKSRQIKSEFYDKSIKLIVDSLNKSFQKEFPYIWLRDYCKCPKCFDSRVLEMNYDFSFQSLDVVPVNVISNPNQSSTFDVHWSDGHNSSYNLLELTDYAFENELKTKPEQLLWNKKILNETGEPMYSFNDFMNEEEVLRSALSSIIKFGFVKIINIPDNIQDSLKAIERIGFIQKTLYGEYTLLTANKMHGDSSYTRVGLKAHNDGTYWKNAPGLQAFQLVKHDGTGGDSLLVDGFYCANRLKKTNPDEFKFLTKAPLKANYIDGNRFHMSHVDPVIKLNPIDETLMQIRYNIFNRCLVNHLSFNDTVDFYRSYQQLGQIIQNPENEQWKRMEKGELAIINNFRILHGRSEYTGNRVLFTAYVPHDDWISKAVTMNIL